MKVGQLLVWLCIPAVLAQTTANPSFGQINATFANAASSPGSAASVLAQSLYFQTAYANDIVTSILRSDYNLKAVRVEGGSGTSKKWLNVVFFYHFLPFLS